MPRTITELPGRRLRVKLSLNSLEEVEGWVLGFGTHATVIGPQELRERLFRASRELFQRGGGPHMLARPDGVIRPRWATARRAGDQHRGLSARRYFHRSLRARLRCHEVFEL